ncbi:DUF397 domain-containing protein [Nocardiopsis sp. Huas11]|uniref:DUF397 domain-containing protein n=1 Tax=Nocardiopsis sp. Huas11 TaxID=2183912 RepID=UPI000EAF5AFE|nr:DUF397 domain-containing protein [Nocardiopsis sp. Huas11]
MSIPTKPWHKSSYSNEAGTCVEVSEGAVTGVRDSQNPHLTSLEFPASAWNRFLSGVGSPRT